MEAATPLRSARVRTLGDRVVADGLVVDDECAVRLVREREETGDDPAALLVDAIEIGARVLDREQAGANADFVRGELEKVTREVNTQIAQKVDEAFGAHSGHVTKALQRHFSDDSSSAVQNRVRQVVAEAMTEVQHSIVRQFSGTEGHNPLAPFQRSIETAVHQAASRHDTNLQSMNETVARLREELSALRAERDKLAELDAERERGTAKGRTFEELVAEELDRLAALQGDDCEAVGDLKGSTGRVGDVVVGIDGCSGPARGRIVFEAKNSKLSRNAALAELDKALSDRDADFAVLVVSSEEKVPAKLSPLREYNGDKMVVTLEPDEGPLGLEVAYRLARARVLMQRSESDGIDAAALRDTVERALNAMESVRAVKSQLTGAKTSIDRARDVLDSMAAQVREHLEHVNELVATGDADGDPAEPPEPAQHSLV
jgi:hypothetical protein